MILMIRSIEKVEIMMTNGKLLVVPKYHGKVCTSYEIV